MHVKTQVTFDVPGNCPTCAQAYVEDCAENYRVTRDNVVVSGVFRMRIVSVIVDDVDVDTRTRLCETHALEKLDAEAK